MGLNKSNLLLISTLVSLFHLKSIIGLQIDLFSEKDRHGLSMRIDVSDNECSNMPEHWGNRAASLNTLGSCVQFYDEQSCKGSLTVIQPFHTIHQMDMSLINFAYRIQSASPCGPKIKSSRYVIQNAADATILTVNSKYGGFARAITVNTSKVIPKNQQWDIIEIGDSEYTLKPREFGDNFPVSFDEESLKKGKIKKKSWKLMSVGRGRYLIKNDPTQKCLYKTEENKVEEHDCRIWSPNQEWVFREIFGNPKAEKNKGASIGPGLNFNVLSKVASYKPTNKPLPQHYPIYYNASALAKIKRVSTAAPYVIRKKIKRGPRPKTKPLGYIHKIRPPGLRPALSTKFSNNNNFLLMQYPGIPNKLPTRPEFIPSDERPEPFDYYQLLLQAHVAQANNKQVPLPGQPRKPINPQDKNTLEGSSSKKSKKKNNSKSVEDEEDEDNENDNNDNEEDDEIQESEEEEETSQNDPPIEIFTIKNKSPTKNQTKESSGFLSKVYSKVKTGIDSVTNNIPIPFMSSKKNETHFEYNVKDYHKHHPHHHKRPSRPQQIDLDYDYESRPHSRPHKRHQNNQNNHPNKRPPGPGLGLRESKRPTTTTTTTPKSSWSLFG